MSIQEFIAIASAVSIVIATLAFIVLFFGTARYISAWYYKRKATQPDWVNVTRKNTRAHNEMWLRAQELWRDE